jgi:hypothetical protein
MPNRRPVAVDITTLPPNLARRAERLIADQQQLNDQLAQLEPRLAQLPGHEKLRQAWTERVHLLAEINDLIDLLRTPIVRLVAAEQHRNRIAARRT